MVRPPEPAVPRSPSGAQSQRAAVGSSGICRSCRDNRSRCSTYRQTHAQPAVAERDQPAQGGEDRAKPDPRNQRVVIGPQHPAALAVRIAERQIEVRQPIGGDRGVCRLAAGYGIPAPLGIESKGSGADPFDDDLSALRMIIGDVPFGYPDKPEGPTGDLQGVAGTQRLDTLAAPSGRDDNPGDQNADAEMGHG